MEPDDFVLELEDPYPGGDECGTDVLDEATFDDEELEGP